jgi:hypothetical protein
MDGARSTYGETKGAFRALVLKPEGRPRHRWEDNIKMVLQVVGCEGMDWFDLAVQRDGWRAVVNAVMSLRVP